MEGAPSQKDSGGGGAVTCVAPWGPGSHEVLRAHRSTEPLVRAICDNTGKVRVEGRRSEGGAEARRGDEDLVGQGERARHHGDGVVTLRPCTGAIVIHPRASACPSQPSGNRPIALHEWK